MNTYIYRYNVWIGLYDVDEYIYKLNKYLKKKKCTKIYIKLKNHTVKRH
jgi:hypothetical protein